MCKSMYYFKSTRTVLPIQPDPSHKILDRHPTSLKTQSYLAFGPDQNEIPVLVPRLLNFPIVVKETVMLLLLSNSGEKRQHYYFSIMNLFYFIIWHFSYSHDEELYFQMYSVHFVVNSFFAYNFIMDMIFHIFGSSFSLTLSSIPIMQSVKPMSPKWSQRTIYLMWKKVFFIFIHFFCFVFKSSFLCFTSFCSVLCS